jgi:hypothetical protein
MRRERGQRTRERRAGPEEEEESYEETFFFLLRVRTAPLDQLALLDPRERKVLMEKMEMMDLQELMEYLELPDPRDTVEERYVQSGYSPTFEGTFISDNFDASFAMDSKPPAPVFQGWSHIVSTLAAISLQAFSVAMVTIHSLNRVSQEHKDPPDTMAFKVRLEMQAPQDLGASLELKELQEWMERRDQKELKANV